MAKIFFKKSAWAGIAAGIALLTALVVPADSARAISDLELGLDYGTFTGLSYSDPRAVAAAIIRVALGLLGTVALIIILIGGYTWMTAGGNEEKVEEAKKWIKAGVIGLAIILSAFAITSFVVQQLVRATQEASNVNLAQ
ncbi:MAG: pilin [Candidatus Magasanikbacteria bacterium]|nr:pilin [Candidatus Magasanikbacteria bacterium]